MTTINALKLKQASFVAYFSHLPPQEAIDRCSKLQGAAEICSDVDNWMAYVARRYGFKYSLQRPDLTTADEWMAHALALEQVDFERLAQNEFRPSHNVHRYIVTLFTEVPATLRSEFQFMNWLNQRVPGGNYPPNITVNLPGLPLVISDASLEAIFHLCRFTVQINRGGFMNDIDIKHRSHDAEMFESSSLCHEWLLELLVPYYSSLVDKGYEVNRVKITSINQEGGIFHNLIVPKNFTVVLLRLKQLFEIENRPFEVNLILDSIEPITISLKYVPAKITDADALREQEIIYTW